MYLPLMFMAADDRKFKAMTQSLMASPLRRVSRSIWLPVAGEAGNDVQDELVSKAPEALEALGGFRVSGQHAWG